jgi:hypothetical protein
MKFSLENWGVILVVGTLVAAVLAVVVGVFLLADAVLASAPWWRRR